MRIIPVLDLKGGQAVHAIAGDRHRYAPLKSVFAPDANPLTLAQGIFDRCGPTEIYIADLDAIVHRAPPAYATIQAIASLGLRVWLDAGLQDAPEAGRLLDAGVTRVIAGLESLEGPTALGRIITLVGPERAIFSLDLRDGVPLIPAASTWLGNLSDEQNLIHQALAVGIRSIIRLDLATVGTNQGVASIPPVPLAFSQVEWITGGGITSSANLITLALRGYSASLVGSAVHDGRIKATDQEI